DIGALAAQIQLIKEQIDALQAYLQQLLQSRDSVVKAINSINTIRNVEGNIMVYLDPHLNAAISAGITDRNILVHLGLNVYAKLSFDEAVSILEERRARLDKAIENTRSTIANLIALHDRYQSVLQSAISEAEAKKLRG
ncbi:MAG: prefoldin subunit alpha, partial [Acidilobaceae archaeon]